MILYWHNFPEVVASAGSYGHCFREVVTMLEGT
jgi:hypothetical protein